MPSADHPTDTTGDGIAYITCEECARDPTFFTGENKLDRYSLPSADNLDYYDEHFGPGVGRAAIPRDPQGFRDFMVGVFVNVRQIEVALVRLCVPCISIFRAPGSMLGYRGHSISLSNSANMTKLVGDLPVRFDALGFQ